MANKLIYSAGLIFAATLTLTSCQEEEVINSNDRSEVLLTVTAVKDADTRTYFEENAGELDCKWSADDKIVVTDTQGNNLGVLTLQSGADNETGVFVGSPKLGGIETINLTYLGNSYRTNLETVSGNLPISLSQQSGEFEAMADKDVLGAKTSINVHNGMAEVSVNMTRVVTYAHFTLSFPDDFTLAAGDAIQITDAAGALYSNTVVNLADFGIVKPGENELTKTITINKTTPGNDIYVTMLPCGDVAPTFTVVRGKKAYSATMDHSHNFQPSEYVRNDNGNGTYSGVTVAMGKIDVPTNPSDVSDWGGNFTPISLYENGDIQRKYDSGGYCTNNYSLYITGGWCTPVTFYANGVVNGYLFSTVTQRPSYFQWGRWLGFPENIGSQTLINGYGQPVNGVKYDMAVPFQHAINYNAYGWTYANTQYGQIPAGNFYRMDPTDYVSSGWDKTLSIRASHIFAAMDPTSNSYLVDYLKTNENCSWEDRTGNPCPDGWRIPTKDEMSALIPGEGTYTLPYATVRNGFAMKWETTTMKDGDTTIPAIKVTSVATELTSVTASNSIFNSADASSIVIGAYGYLNNLGEKLKYKACASLWTSSSGKDSSKSGYGGVQLKIWLDNGNRVEFEFVSQHRSFASPVIPIRDDKAKASSLVPWFPAKWKA